MTAKRRQSDCEQTAERAAKHNFAAKTEPHESSSTLEPNPQQSQTERLAGHSNVGEPEGDDLVLPIQDHNLALDEDNLMTKEGYMKFCTLKDHERIEAFLTEPAPCLRCYIGSEETVTRPKDGTRVAKAKFSVGRTEVELDASLYANLVEHSALFKKDTQMTLEEFHQRYVSRMSNSDLFNLDDVDMVSVCESRLRFGLVRPEKHLIEYYFDLSFKTPLVPILEKFIEVDKDRVSNDYLDYLPRIEQSFKDSEPRGTASTDVSLLFSFQASMTTLGLNCSPDLSLGLHCLVGSGSIRCTSMEMITPMVLGATERPENKLQRGYTWLVDNDGETSLNETMPTAVSNFKEVSDKLISQSVYVNARKCFITTYDYLFLFELEIDKTTKLLKCRHIMFPTTTTKAVVFYLLSFLMHDKHDWLKDQEFRDHKHLIPNILQGPPEQSGESKPKTIPSPSALSMPAPSAKSVNNEQHDYGSLDWKACSNSKANYGYSIARMANKVKIPTHKYLMSFIGLVNSQVLEVNKDIFAHIEPSNRLIDLCDAVDGVLKVIDPAWTDYYDHDAVHISDRGVLLSKRYQKAADTICNELEIYHRISEKQIAPKVLAFGILEDPVSFELGPRFQGPFFIMEKVERHEKSWRNFTKDDFVKVRDSFQALWDCNIVHGDISSRNIILDKNGDIKLIDFGSSRITEDPKEFEEELKCLKRLFSIE